MKKLSSIIIVPEVDGISRIKLNEPDTYNALSYNTLKSLVEAFKFLNNQKKGVHRSTPIFHSKYIEPEHGFYSFCNLGDTPRQSITFSRAF